MWERGLKPFDPCRSARESSVAPHVGAWIETLLHPHLTSLGGSLPMWERGLKLPSGTHL